MTHLAVAIPAYNEARGIAGLLEELDRELKSVADEITFVVVDDCSTDATQAVLPAVRRLCAASSWCSGTRRTSSHGPTVWRAYRAALDTTTADVVAQVDGDGQFRGRWRQWDGRPPTPPRCSGSAPSASIPGSARS